MSSGGASLTDEMDATVWTAIGLLAATSLGTLFYLGSRIDALSARMDARLDAEFSRVDAGFSRVDAGFSRVDARIDTVVTSTVSPYGSTPVWISTRPEASALRCYPFSSSAGAAPA
jgi:hypothetical protein